MTLDPPSNPSTLSGYVIDGAKKIANNLITNVERDYNTLVKPVVDVVWDNSPLKNLIENVPKPGWIHEHKEFIQRALPTTEDAVFTGAKTAARIAETAGRFTHNPYMQAGGILAHNVAQGLQKQRQIDRHNAGEHQRIVDNPNVDYKMMQNTETGVKKAFMKPLTRMQWLTMKAQERQQHKVDRPILRKNYLNFARVLTPRYQKYTKVKKPVYKPKRYKDRSAHKRHLKRLQDDRALAWKNRPRTNKRIKMMKLDSPAAIKEFFGE